MSRIRLSAAACSAVVLLSAFPVAAAVATNLKPGLYDTRFVMNLNGPGMPALPRGEQHRRLCLSASDLKDDPRKLIDRLLAPSGLRCVYKDLKQTPQSASVVATCEYLALRSTGTAKASFQADRFNFASDHALTTPLGEAIFKVNGVGTRLGDCTLANSAAAPPASRPGAAAPSAPAPVVSAPLPPTTPRAPIAAPARDR